MSVIIEDMTMPECCMKCPMKAGYGCEYMGVAMATKDMKSGRHPDCPLEEADDGWIPCTDHLPEEYEVLCCDIRGEIMIGHPFSDKESETGYSAEDEIVRMYDCIAWIPLPKPYQQKEYAQ